jgi:CubicO group peptidase (beta-lactamase class C family)
MQDFAWTPGSSGAQHVENGLLPAIVIRGEPLVAMRLADRMTHHCVPGVGLAFSSHGEIQWTASYGLKSAGSEEAVTAKTLFQAGSISKALTAVAALRLVEQGRLTLDDDVNEQLLSWKLADNEYTLSRKVTLRDLLNHSAGVTNHAVGSYASGAPLPTLTQALDGVTPATTEPVRVDSVPGTEWRYSGGGYGIVQQLLMDVTRAPFPDLMTELVLQPVGMEYSTFEQPLPRRLEPSAASGHDFGGTPLEGRWHVFPEMAAAGLWSTPSDLARFANALWSAWAGKPNGILSQSSARLMLTPHLGDCGLGIFLGGEGRGRYFDHGGDTDGYKCEMVMFLELGQGAVIMTNADRGERLAHEILRSFAHEYGWPGFQPEERTVGKADPDRYPLYAGEYSFVALPEIRAVVSAEEGRLMLEILQPIGRNKGELLPEAPDSFFSRETGTRVIFSTEGGGRPDQLVLRQSDGEYAATRMG